MLDAIGRKRWAIAEGYIPPSSTGSSRQLTSHETVCILNAADSDAEVAIHVFFADRDPARPLQVHHSGAADTAHTLLQRLQRPRAHSKRH